MRVLAVLASCCVFAALFVVGGIAHSFGRGRFQKHVFRNKNVCIARINNFAFTKSAQKTRLATTCLKEMPLMLDIVTLGLSAGLSFDAALELFCLRSQGLLASKLSLAQLAWRMGITSRQEALANLAKELDIAALTRFSSVVCEALRFGTPLAEALEGQAALMRDEQRFELEEKIEQVPVKMLIPLGVLIVPAMLLAILGPLLGSALQLS